MFNLPDTWHWFNKIGQSPSVFFGIWKRNIRILSVKSSDVAPAEIQEHHDLTTKDYYLSKGLRWRFPTVGFNLHTSFEILEEAEIPG